VADLPKLALGTFTNVNDTAITGTEPVLQLIADVDDNKNVHDTANTTHTGGARFALANMPADFVSMDTLSVQLRYAWQSGTQVNAWTDLRAQVLKSDLITLLTGNQPVTSSITTSAPTNSLVVAFEFVDTAATKEDWDGAIVEILFQITKSKGGDALEERVFAAELTGTYTAGSPEVTSSGSLEAQNSAISGMAEREETSSGSLSAEAAGIDGIAEREIVSAGALAAQDAGISGAAAVGSEITTAGALAAEAADIAGSAERQITASGNLAADDSAINGLATVGDVLLSSGALAAQAAQISGVAQRVLIASGALISAGASLSGLAAIPAVPWIPGYITSVRRKTPKLRAMSKTPSLGSISKTPTHTIKVIRQ
jgi:hypothetical protein